MGGTGLIHTELIPVQMFTQRPAHILLRAVEHSLQDAGVGTTDRFVLIRLQAELTQPLDVLKGGEHVVKVSLHAAELKGAAMNAKRIALLIVGILIPIAIGVVSVALNTSDASEAATNVFASVKWWQVLLCLPVGYIVGVTQIVPGLSATAVLMALGWFKSLVDSVSLTFWKSNPAILLVYAALVIGFLLGLFTFSKFLNYVFGKARHTAYSMIVGLSLGSIVSMFYNPDIFSQAYIPWKESGVEVWDLVLGIALFAVGAICSYMLVRYQRKKDAEAAKAAETAPAAQPEEDSDADGENG